MGDWGNSRCLKVRRINDDPRLVFPSDASETKARQFATWWCLKFSEGINSVDHCLNYVIVHVPRQSRVCNPQRQEWVDLDRCDCLCQVHQPWPKNRSTTRAGSKFPKWNQILTSPAQCTSSSTTLLRRWKSSSGSPSLINSIDVLCTCCRQTPKKKLVFGSQWILFSVATSSNMSILLPVSSELPPQKVQLCSRVFLDQIACKLALPAFVKISWSYGEFSMLCRP